MKRTILLLGFAFLCAASSSKAQSSKEDSINRHKACYTQALQELEAMLQGKAKPNFERAVFLMENAYYANQFSYEAFQNVLDRKEADIRLLKEMQRLVSGGKLKAYKPSIWERAQQTPEQRTKALENLMGNWAIYAYMKDTVFRVMKDSLRFIVHQKPYRYSRSDPMGTSDWRNTQVMNLIANGEGNCFALATLYKIFADRLQTDALLATAPSHIFIRHADEEGRMFNVELSNSSFPGTGTMETLTYTTKEATQNNLAMRNLNPTQSIALCLVYLAKGYEQLFHNNTEPIVMRCADLALQYDSLSLNALLLKSEVLQSRVLAQKKTIAQLKNEGDFKQLEQLTTKLYQLGYREMPLEMRNFLIQRWTQDSSTILIKRNYAYQAPNGSGVTPTRYASLSWGMFDEEIPHKATEHYGRFLYDTKAQRLSAIAPEQELYNHYNFDPVAFAMNVDPLAHKFPSWSPYSAFGDNPIMNIDVDGAYQYPADKAAAYKKTYPMLTKYLAEYVQKDVKKSQTVQNAIVKNTYGGYTNSELTNHVTAWNDKSSPEITFSEGLAERTNAYGHTSDSKHFEIDAEFAKAMDDILGDKNVSEKVKQAAITSFYSTLIDETTHTGDLKDGVRDAEEVGKDATLEIFFGKLYKDEKGEFWVHQLEIDDPSNKKDLSGTTRMVERKTEEGKSDVLPTVPQN